MDDARDLVLVERALDSVQVGDVAADERHEPGVVAEHEPQPCEVLAEVEADDLVAVGERLPGGPGAEAAEDARHQDAPRARQAGRPGTR